MADIRPIDSRQSADRFFGELFFTIPGLKLGLSGERWVSPVHPSCDQHCKYSYNKLDLSTKSKILKPIQLLPTTPPLHMNQEGILRSYYGDAEDNVN